MTRRRTLTLLVLAILGLIVFVTFSAGQVAAVRIATDPPGLAFESNSILIALPLTNVGAIAANNVNLTKISLGAQTLVKPAALPLTVGSIPAGQDAVVQLAFVATALPPGSRAMLTVAGTYRAGTGATLLGFQVNRVLTMPPADDGAVEPTQVTVDPLAASGGNNPPSPDGFHPNEANEVEGTPIPEGQVIGDFNPVGPALNIPGVGNTLRAPEAQNLAANDPVSFVRQGGLAVQQGFGFHPWDPSGASVDLTQVTGAVGSRLVFLTGNTYALISTDGGGSFTRLDPTTIFPNVDGNGILIDGGMCCDQVVQYIPSIDRVVWLMQFWGVKVGTDAQGKPILGKNRLRIAAASPAQIVASGGTSWTYWNMTATGTFNLGNHFLDYPDMSFTNNNLHISIDDTSSGLFVIRAPLSEIQAGVSLHLRYTDPANGTTAYGSHLTQDSPDAAYWFGQPTTSTLRIFEWPDSSTSYSWRTRNVNSWNSSDYVSNQPNGIDWLSFGFGRYRIRGATVRVNQAVGQGSVRIIKVAWSAARGGGFAQPYIRLLDVNKVDPGLGLPVSWGAGNESQMWNASVAVQFPYLSTNTNGEVGISFAYGGGGNYSTPVMGFVGDSTFYFGNKSTTGIERWGDYSAIRKHGGNPKLFSVSDYFLQAPSGDFPKGRVIHQYRLFGRTADVGGTF